MVIARGLVVPTYAARTPRPTLLGPYETYVRERVAAWPELSGVRLLRELRERGYVGGVTQLNDFLRAVRPSVVTPFEVRFETPAGRQAQVDFAHFMVEFTEQPGVQHRVWLFAMVLGHSRYLLGSTCCTKTWAPCCAVICWPSSTLVARRRRSCTTA